MSRLTVRLEHLNPTVGDLQGNARAILNAWRAASAAGADVLALPELVLPGYPPMDLLDSPAFCERVFEINGWIARHVTGKTALLFGSLTPSERPTGRRLRNSALLAKDGRVVQAVHKTLLPTYDVFDEARYFEPGDAPGCIEVSGRTLGVLICEDLFHNVNEPPAPTYPVEPAAVCMAHGAEALLVLSASPFTLDKHETRMRLLKGYARAHKVPLLYCNQVGANTELVFDGDTFAVDAEGERFAAAEPFEPSWVDVPLFEQPAEGAGTQAPANGDPGTGDPGTGDPGTGDPAAAPGRAVRSGRYPESVPERMFNAIRLGIRDYFKKTTVSDRALLGLSGGIDSALVCTLCAAALGPERVTAIGLPSRYSSEGSLSDSRRLCDALGVEWVRMPIEPVFEASLETLAPWFAGGGPGLAEENLQSRIRGVLLMAWSNRFGHLLMATGNKSEMSVGYSTLYGDMCGALAPIADLYKTEVYQLARWLNEHGPRPGAIPEAILTKPPSAELRPGQLDTDSLPPYDVLDPILHAYLEKLSTPAQIASMGHPRETVDRILRMVDQAEYKRFQAPPVLKLHHRAFGTGRRLPLAARITHQGPVDLPDEFSETD